MVSDFLYSSYANYKTDTNIVATWLLATAKEHGCREYDKAGSTTVSNKALRLKGKARKLARDAGTTANSESTLPVYNIKVKDFVNLARYITNCKKARVEVPEYLIRRLRRAIKTRKAHHRFYNSQSGTESEPTPQKCGHAYFIATLEAVHGILSPDVLQTFKRNDDQDTSDLGDNHIDNMFEHLTIEELEDTTDSDKVDKSPALAAKFTVTIDDSGAEDKEEAFIASIHLSRDLHRLRLLVQEFWNSYQEGSTDLAAASISTNTAIDFCRKLGGDFEKAFPNQDRLHERGCLYCVLRSSGGAHWEVPCLVSAHKILSGFLANTQNDSPNTLLMVKPTRIEVYHQTKDRTSMDMKEQMIHDAIIAHGVISEFCALIRATDRVQAEHEIIRALRNFTQRREPDLWVTFAIQVHLDIRHILRKDVARGFDDLCRGGRSIMSNIKRALDFHRQVGVKGSPQFIDGSLEEVLGFVARCIDNDHVCELTDRQNIMVDPSTAAHVPRHYLLRRNPLWCGLLLYNFRMVAHEGSIITSNSGGFIAATAHLYNCTRQANTLRRDWADMERVISMHRAETLFVGDRPTTIETCTKCCGLAFGIPASSMAPGRRAHITEMKRSKPRRLGYLAPVTWTFKTRFCDGDSRTDLGPADVERTLRKQALDNPERRDPASSEDACSVLQELWRTLQDETVEVTFDHLQMHIICWKLLRQLYDARKEDLPVWATPYIDARNLAGFPLHLLMDAMEEAKMAASLGLSDVASAGPTLWQVGELLEDLVAREGHVAGRDA